MKSMIHTNETNNSRSFSKKVIILVVAILAFVNVFAQNQHSFEVTVIGKGKPVLLIPGYSCSGDVWKETVAHLKNKYELHVITIAGFGGVKPIENEEILKTVHNDIIQYVNDKKLKKPMIIGHSLGAFMTLWLQSSQPKMFGKSICVDGLPFVSAVGKPEITAEITKNNPQFNKQAVIKNFESLPSEGYVKNMTKAMLYQVNDSVRAKQIAEWSFKSDRKTLGSTIVEMSTTDLRQEISKIEAPILILASLWGTKEASEKEYGIQYVQLKNKTIKVAEAKHFIMYDQPEWFYNEIDLFLNSKS
ncbi:alpha/beta hydrolase [Flavobacterium amnicola]|uniref:Alpha/beta hydrolase n=1 Tax=Flavobacterium amnicola TaxID=2506422 RepID=A0A4V1N1Q0_9FLAO|nr:alpha/beta hydrolase [Flavobacterium amnicola]RXR17220.1 alpha/beta hydrolase [Flavobacterium amnicola]